MFDTNVRIGIGEHTARCFTLSLHRRSGLPIQLFNWYLCDGKNWHFMVPPGMDSLAIDPFDIRPLHPEHTMSTTLTPYLSFGGNTREAFAFYEKALGAKIETMMSYADMPPMPAGDAGCADGPPPSGDGIMHACLALPGGAMLFAGDTPPGMPYEGVKGVMLALQYDTIDQAHGAFHALSQGGQVTMPLAPSFWAKSFGMLTDRFGVSWAVNGEPIAFG
jgi:PhnB protein